MHDDAGHELMNGIDGLKTGDQSSGIVRNRKEKMDQERWNKQQKLKYGCFRREGFLVVMAILGLLLCGCGKKEQETGKLYHVYSLNNDETAIASHEYRTETTDQEALIQELLEQLSMPADRLQYRAPLSGNVQLLSESVTEEQLLLDFSEEYYHQPVTTEVLTRAAIVRTLSQVDGVTHISFQVKEEPLVDTYGNVVGVMNADMFIDNDGNEINTYEKAKLLLYFANEDGTRLRTVTRNVVYSSNISMERLIVEQLLLGPQKNEDGYPVLNPATKIQSVTVKDGTCYVNLDASFWTKSYNVSSDVLIYSIVNSLAELSSVNRVQITIDTEGAVDLKDNTSLQPSYERNLDIVE